MLTRTITKFSEELLDDQELQNIYIIYSKIKPQMKGKAVFFKSIGIYLDGDDFVKRLRTLVTTWIIYKKPRFINYAKTRVFPVYIDGVKQTCKVSKATISILTKF